MQHTRALASRMSAPFPARALHRALLSVPVVASVSSRAAPLPPPAAAAAGPLPGPARPPCADVSRGSVRCGAGPGMGQKGVTSSSSVSSSPSLMARVSSLAARQLPSGSSRHTRSHAATPHARSFASTPLPYPPPSAPSYLQPPPPPPLDFPLPSPPRSVLLVKKWGSRSAARYARAIAADLTARGSQVFIEPTTADEFGTATAYPTILDLIARTDPGARAAFKRDFASVVDETFSFAGIPRDSIDSTSSSASSSPAHLGSPDLWRGFSRSPAASAALSDLDPRECIAFARRHGSWQRHIDLAVCVGGDGTLLHISTLFPHLVPPTLAFGCGSFGFLMPFDPDAASSTLSALYSGRLRLMNRHRLAFKVGGSVGVDERGAPIVPPFTETDQQCFHLLNEVVLKHSYGLNVGVGVSEIECRIDGAVLARFQGDGVMVASPTGSTAYSLAAGGSIVHPALDCLLVSPICPMTLSSRPLVLPGASTLSLTPVHDAVLLEGKYGRVLQPAETVTIRRSAFPVPVFTRQGATSDFVADLGGRFNYARLVRVRREEPAAGYVSEVEAQAHPSNEAAAAATAAAADVGSSTNTDAPASPSAAAGPAGGTPADGDEIPASGAALGPLGSFMSKREQEAVTQDRECRRPGAQGGSGEPC